MGSEGRIAIADGVYISSGAYISSDDDGVHISSGADVRKDSVASRSVSSFSARPARVMMTSAYSASNEDSAGEELPSVNWEEIISANPYDGEMRAVIRQYLNAGYTAEDLTKQLASLSISFSTKCRILTIILQSQASSAEADTQVKNMSAFTEANNLSKAESASTRKSLRIPHKDKAKVVGKELRTPDYIKNGFKLTSENTKKLGLASVADDKKLEQIVNEMKEMLNSPNTSSTSNTTTASSGEEGTDASSGNKEVGGALVVNGGTLSIGSEKMNEPLRAGKRIVLDGDEKTGASLTWTDASSIGGEKTDNILVAAANALGGTLSIGSEKMNEPLRAGKITVSLGDEKIDTSLQSNLTVGSLTNRDRLFAD